MEVGIPEFYDVSASASKSPIGQRCYSQDLGRRKEYTFAMTILIWPDRTLHEPFATRMISTQPMYWRAV